MSSIPPAESGADNRSEASDPVETLRAERDTLSVEREALLAERDALLAERDALAESLAEATAAVVRWRSAALNRWEAAAPGGLSLSAQQEIEAMRNTVSWRVTKPLRAVRTRMPDIRGTAG